MNLALDFGNTAVKAALFDGRDLKVVKSYNSSQLLLEDVSFLSQAKQCIICSVTKDNPDLTSILPKECNVSFFTSQTKTPIENCYHSVSTLGSDRLAASIGGFSLYPDKNLLVIDAGTCLKYNFTNEKNQYLGGAISPGIQMRFKALNQFTARLPLVNFDQLFDKLIGQTTEESILSGVLNGIIGETDSIIDKYKKQFPDIIIVSTGGDYAFFAKHLKNRIFAHPDLVLIGLNEILIYNS